ncbi:hypothetical protein predicted by Glimmer/Critica [Sorangium cellulosum So ce56]|uniref:Uncharacterized protein n=1 Tax=Sorangium cellulosum (strain So ce56) TaxID=448385 RepID=A9FP91_SORC5|nr:hypothetical protein [Sorangium cellulosum]CAN92035.1 hypothetical protein predicted by Glimmer/Critica [Sorangium cellulosum So ce56]
MRTSLAIGLLLSVSISSLLVGSGCTITLAPDPDPPAGSTGGEGGNGGDVDQGAGGGEDPGSEGGGGRLPPPPPSACWLGDMGDGFTCHDTATLRDHAQARCARMGAELASFVSDTLNPSCAEHESSEVVFECCGGEPPPPPPPNSCWKGELGDGSSCIDMGAIKDRAYAMCVSAGARLTWLDALPDPGRCGLNEATKATFECCGSTPPPPPPRACWKGELGDRRSCVDPSALKEQAYAACSRSAADLTFFDYERNNPSCAAHETTWGYFECCGSEPPPPPPPPPSGACWKGELGDGLSCVDRTVMKDRAYATCVSAGASFTSFSYEQDNPRCTGNETSKAVFECCGVEPPPPPPEACWGGSLGDGTSCIDASALKERAYATCASDGAELAAFDPGYDGRCAAYESSHAKFTCCASKTPPPR